jgi:superfamily II DNA or RNA helicase
VAHDRFQKLTSRLTSGEWRLLAALAAEESLGSTALSALSAELDVTLEGGAALRDWLALGLGEGLLAKAGRVRALALSRPSGEEPAFGVHPEWRELVLRESQRRGELEGVVGAGAVVLGERSRGRSAWLLQKGDLRGASGRALGGRTRVDDGGDPGRFLRESICQPFDPEWFAATWGAARMDLSCRVLREALPSLADCGGLYAWLAAEEASKHSEELSNLLCQHALLREDLATAERCSALVPAVTRLAFNAVLAYERGHDSLARQALEQSLAFSSNKGRAALPHAGALSPVLALLILSASGDGGAEVAQRLVSAKAAGDEAGGANRALRSMLRYGAEPESKRKRIDPYQVPRSASAWEVWFQGLTVHVHVPQELSRAAWAKYLGERASEWLRAGYVFMGRQTHFLAEALGGEPFPARPGELRLADLLAPKSDWERALDRLSHASEAVSAEVEFPLRVAWFADMTRGELNRPALEEYAPESGWSQGHRVSLEELEDRKGELPPEDRRVLDKTTQTGKEPREYQPEAWEALIGHPRVYNGARGKLPVEVVRGECRVVTEDDGAFLKVVVEPEGATLGVNVVVEDEARAVVYRVTPAMHRVIAAVPRALRIPRHEERRALAVLEKLARAVPVRSAHLGADRAVEAESTPCLRIASRAGAWLVEGGVRPFGAGGRFFVVGTGPSAISHTAEGQTLRTRRDFELERARLSSLITDCPSLLERALDLEDTRLPGESRQTWAFDFDGLLGLLAELRDAGTACELEWGQATPLRVRGRVSAAGLHGLLRRVKGWYLLTGSVRIDEVTELSLSELLRLPTLSRGRFVELPNGDYLEVERRMRRVMAALATATSGAPSERELRLHESAYAAVKRLSESASFETDGTVEGFVEELERVRARDFEVPKALRGELRSYQLEGFRWLCALGELGLGACLADDMGLGKTVQILAALLSQPGPTLVVAPTSVCANWIAEIARFAPTASACEYGGNDRERTLELARGGDDTIVVCSYALLQQDIEELASIEWSSVVLDEAQFIKNPVSLRAQAAFRLRARRRIAATGTPVENHLGDLWSVFRFLNPELFGSWQNFDLRFARPIERDHDREQQEALRALVRPYVLRRTKAQVLSELPPITTVRHEIRLNDEEALRYAILRRRIHEKLRTVAGRQQYKLEILAEITRLRRFCCHPQLVFPDAQHVGSKVESFLTLVEELRENGHRALVFSQFVDFLDIVRASLEERAISYEYLDGSTPKADRKRRVDAFQSGGAPLFLISLKAGGFGLNLTAADYVIHLDPWWNPAVEAQASDRAHRIGQERPVTVYRLVTKDTIEEQIVELHAGKRKLADQLLEGGDVAGKLSTDELLDLIAPPGES